MKTLGLLGGMSYNATTIYYNLINQHIQHRLGGSNGACLLLHSFNHAKMSTLFTTNAWDAVTSSFVFAGRNMKAGGADAVVICCNIGHRVAGDVEREVGLPVLHVADYTGLAIAQRQQQQGDEKIERVALIGTKPVMEQEFFKESLKTKYGIDVVVPCAEKRDAIQDMIFKELGANIFHDGQRQLLLDVIEETKVDGGAQGVVFACTDLQFVLKSSDVEMPLWDTLEVHARGVAEWALSGDGDGNGNGNG